MKSISFALTTDQIRCRTKTVTRRTGWRTLKPGDLLQAVVKGMGLRKGESPERLSILRVIDVRREPLHAIDDDDVCREGFIMPAHDFVEMFCDHMKCDRDQMVTRIEFRYVPGGAT